MRVIVALCLTYTLLFSGSGHAETITGAGDPWPPYVGSDLPNQGIALELVRAAFKTQGYTLEMKFVPWIRAINGVKSGKYDILPSSWWTEERSYFLRYSKPYVKNEVKFIKRIGDDFEYQGLESLTGKSIGIVRGYGYGDAFMKATHFTRFEAPTLLPNLKLVNANRVNLTLEDELVARSIINSEAPQLMDQLVFTKNVFSTKHLHVSSAIAHPKSLAIITAFDKGLVEIKRSGLYTEILSKYGVTAGIN